MRTHISFVWAALLVLFGLATALPTYAAPASATAGDLRVALDSLLTEHVALASSATNAAIGGRDAEYKAAVAALDANSVDLSKAIGSVYGADAENAFLSLWRKHIGFFVDYTQGAAAKDQAKKDKAMADLTQYGQDFGAFLNSANPNLPKQAVADLLAPHVKTLTSVIDAQAAGDPATAFMNERMAFAHMTNIATALSNAIVKQFPDKFGGGAAMPAVMPNTGAADVAGYGSTIVLAIALMALGLIVTRRRAA